MKIGHTKMVHVHLKFVQPHEHNWKVANQIFLCKLFQANHFLKVLRVRKDALGSTSGKYKRNR